MISNGIFETKILLSGGALREPPPPPPPPPPRGGPVERRGALLSLRSRLGDLKSNIENFIIKKPTKTTIFMICFAKKNYIQSEFAMPRMPALWNLCYGYGISTPIKTSKKHKGNVFYKYSVRFCSPISRHGICHDYFLDFSKIVLIPTLVHLR